MTIEAVILDADGVVIFPWRFAHHLERAHGITPEMTRPFFRGVFEDCLVGKADVREVLPPFLDQWGWKGSVDDFMTSWLQTENAADDRVIEVVRRLRRWGVMCCLATSQERNRAEYMKTAMGFLAEFDKLFFSYEMGCQKPDHRYFEAIERDLGLAGEGILFWDDSAVNVESARERGWNAEMYTGFEMFEKRLGNYVAYKAA